jgi:hypothetical protein
VADCKAAEALLEHLPTTVRCCTGTRATTPTLYTTVSDCLIDARQVLHHDPARPQIEMADLGVAHLALRQPDVKTRSTEEGMRTT